MSKPSHFIINLIQNSLFTHDNCSTSAADGSGLISSHRHRTLLCSLRSFVLVMRRPLITFDPHVQSSRRGITARKDGTFNEGWFRRRGFSTIRVLAWSVVSLVTVINPHPSNRGDVPTPERVSPLRGRKVGQNMGLLTWNLHCS
jgi:hypothetical protein